MKILLYGFITILSIKSLNAQDYRPGFIIKLNSDSIAGFVENNSPKSNSKVCHFKKSRGSKREVYMPNELKGYGLLDYKYFESVVIKNDRNNQIQVFVEVLVKGKASLYNYLETFYFQKDSIVLLPKISTKEIYVDNSRYFKNNTHYISILNMAMVDCGLRADKVLYEERSLVNLVQNYNRCLGLTGLVFKTKKKWTKFNASVFTAYDHTTAKLDGFENYSFSSNSVAAGAGLEFSSPRLSDKTFLTIEAWYLKKVFQGYSEVVSSNSVTRSDLFLEPSFIKIPVAFKYNFLQERSTPYFKVGISQYFLTSYTAYQILETESAGVVVTDKFNVTIDKQSQTGLWFGAGYSKQFNHFINAFFELRYERYNVFVYNAPNSTSVGNSLSVLVGLKF